MRAIPKRPRSASRVALLLLVAALLVAAVQRSPARAASQLLQQATPTLRATARATVRASATPRTTATPRHARATATPRATLSSRLPTPAATGASSAPASSTLIAAGLEAYKTLGCNGCHRLAEAGSNATFGPSHDHEATNAAEHLTAADYAGAATSVAEYLRESIIAPEAYVPEGYRKVKYRMPAFSHATEAQVEALVALLLEQE